MNSIRDILYAEAETYKIGKEIYISYKEEVIYKSTVIHMGGQLIEKTEDYKEVWLIQSKMEDVYWIIEDVRLTDPLAYHAFISPF